MGDYNVDLIGKQTGVRFPEEWLAAMRAPIRRERVSVKLSRSSEKQDIDIIQDSLYISHKVMGSKFDLGTCCSSELGVTFIDDNAINTDYGGATAYVVYSLYIGEDKDGSEKWYFSTEGPFIIDGQKARRVGNQVTVKGYDILSNFDVDIPKDDMPAFSCLWEAVIWLCNVVPRVNLIRYLPGMKEEEFNKLPNADIVPDFSSDQIKSCRDAMMWIAQATGTCLCGDLTFRQYKYDGEMKSDRVITAQERDKIEFTDTRTYCAYLSTDCAGKTKTYSNVVDWDESWEPQYIKTGALSLPKNPIISKLSEQAQDTVNRNILKNMSRPTRYIKMQGDVDFLLKPLDVAAFTGGTIDIRSKIIAPVTEIKWKYRGTGTIVCQNVEEYTDAAPPAAEAVMLMSEEGISTQAETAATVHSPVYSQFEKAMNAASAGGNKAKELIGTFNGLNGDYIFKWLSPYEIAAINPQGEKLFYLLAVSGGIELSSTQSSSKCFEIRTTGNGLIIDSKGGENHIELAQGYIIIRSQSTQFFARSDGYFEIGPNGGMNTFYVNPSVGYMEFKAGNGSFFVNLSSGEIKINDKKVKLIE